MNQKYYKILVALTCGLLFSSCTVLNANKKSIPDTLSFTDIIREVNENSLKIKCFEGDGTIDFESPENDNSVSVNIRHNVVKDSIYARVSGIFGVTGALLSLNPGNFIFYNVQNSYVIKGASTRKNISSILKINISYDELINIICAAFIFDSTFKVESINSNDVSYILSGLKSGLQQKFYIDAQNKFITKFICYNKSSNLEYEIEYKDYRLMDGIYFPMDITFNVPSKSETIKLNYSNINLNPDGLKYYFKIAKNVEVYNW